MNKERHTFERCLTIQLFNMTEERDAGMTETGPRTYQGASNILVLNTPRCGGCGEFFFQGIPVDHVCKTTTGGTRGPVSQ